MQAAIDRLQTSRATTRALTQENIGRFQLEDDAAASNLFPQWQASLDRAQTALASLEASQLESANRIQSAFEERLARAEKLVLSSAADENIGGTVAPSHRLTLEREAARPANYVERVENAETSAAEATSFREPELPFWDMNTKETRAEWTQGRLDARTRFKAEAQAAQLIRAILISSLQSKPRHVTLLQLPDGKARMGTTPGGGLLSQ